MIDIDEAVLAIKAAKENTNCPVVCSFTFEKTIQGQYRTMMGASPEETVKASLDAGADIIGTNCGNGFSPMIEIVRQIRAAAPEAPIIVHANAGKPTSVDGVDVFPETPEETADLVPEMIAAGANIIGGCCGTTPAHITAIKTAVEAATK
jgi:5-methyltetrahydrofolate--homocysteine methyltransferase